MSMNCAIYARVSTRDRQEVENQLIQLRQYAEAQHWKIVNEFIDHVTGSRKDRLEFQALFTAAEHKRCDVVLVWALDRFSREGVLQTFLHIQRLSLAGVKFESLMEPHFRTTGPTGELLLAIAAWVAEQERARIVERVNAGIARARAGGMKFGRPKKVFDRELVRQLRATGLSFRKVAAQVGGISDITVRRLCQGETKGASVAAAN